MPDYRELKNRIRISSTLDKEIYQKLKEYANETDIPVTRILDRAIVLYLESVEK